MPALPLHVHARGVPTNRSAPDDTVQIVDAGQVGVAKAKGVLCLFPWAYARVQGQWQVVAALTAGCR
jgi:hypothetical protein